MSLNKQNLSAIQLSLPNFVGSLPAVRVLELPEEKPCVLLVIALNVPKINKKN